jgi:hypothetical protein
MTGALTLPADPTAALQAATKQYADLKVAKAGDTMTGDLAINKTHPAMVLLKTASGQNSYVGGYLGSNPRWLMMLGDSAAESSGNAGSNFVLNGYNDAGSFLSIPLLVKRSFGTIALGGFTNGVIDLDQGGVCIRCSNSITGIMMRGMTAGAPNYEMSFFNSALTSVGFIQTTDTATAFVTSSDVRLKNNIEPYAAGRETLDKIGVIQFNWKEDGSYDVGISAQQAQPAYPKAIMEGKGELGKEGFMPWGVDYSKYVPLLIQALQQAFKEIDALKAQVSALKGGL